MRIDIDNKVVLVNEDKKTVTVLLYYKNKKYVGVAKCSPDDYFDMDTGRRIAYLRARRSIMNDIREEIRMNINYAQSYIKQQKQMYESITNKICKINRKINEIPDENIEIL